MVPEGGFLLLDKPPGITSFKAAEEARFKIGARRSGHGGTLDPAARGLLVVAFEFSTRLLSFCLGLDKTYEAEVLFGRSTDTHDLDGTVLDDRPACPPEAEVRAALAAFAGECAQVPPMFSALKLGGKSLHELAREGKSLDLTSRTRVVTLHAVDGVAYHPGPQARVSFRVHCSSGTYVRCLARDLGARLGVPAVLSGLVRTAVGPFPLGEACALGDVAPAVPGQPRGLIPPERFLARLGVPTVTVDADWTHRFLFGNPARVAEPAVASAAAPEGACGAPGPRPPQELGGQVCACDGAGVFLGLATAAPPGFVTPLKVLRREA